MVRFRICFFKEKLTEFDDEFDEECENKRGCCLEQLKGWMALS